MYKGHTAQEWAQVRKDVATASHATGDYSAEACVKWIAARTAECVADGATMQQAVSQAVNEFRGVA